MSSPHSGKKAASRMLHIGPDTVFLSHFSKWVEEVRPGTSDYLVLTSSGQTEVLHPIPSPNVSLVDRKLLGLINHFRAIRQADVIVAHSMSRFAAVAFLLGRRSARRVWSGFGFDYYGQGGPEFRQLLGPLTNRAVTGRTTRYRGIAELLTRSLFRAAARMATHFSAPMPSDFGVFVGEFPSFSGQYIQFKYASLTEMALDRVIPKDGSILVGNSAAYTNNHLDIFAALTSANVKGRAIVVPLSYDGDKEYVQLVLEDGRRRFGDLFEPMTAHMPLDQYLAQIGRCSIVLMGQKRQKALGNIIASVYGGASLVLESKSPMTGFFRQIGVRFRTLNDLEAEGVDALMTSADSELNRLAIERYWGREVVLSELTETLGTLLDDQVEADIGS